MGADPKEGGKILLVAQTFPPLVGGSSVVYEQLAKLSAGDIEVLTSSTDFETGHEIAGWQRYDFAQGFEVHRLAFLRPPAAGPSGSPGRIRELFKIVWTMLSVFRSVRERARLSGATAICVGELWGLGWLVIMLKWLTRHKVIVYVHGEDVTQAGYSVWARLRGPALHAAHSVIAVTNAVKDAAVARYAINPSKITVIPNGVDTSIFRPVDRSRVLKKLPRKILSVGRLVPLKGADHLVEAMLSVVQAIPDVHLTIVGDGPLRPLLEARICELGLADKIALAGALSGEPLVRLYQDCDLFVLPNRTTEDGSVEGFGLVFLEAAACAKPAIGGRSGGVPEVIQHEVTGLLTDGSDIEAISAAILRLLSDHSLYDSCSRGALLWAEQRDWRNCAAAFRKTCLSEPLL